jgi:hypothetical protein
MELTPHQSFVIAAKNAVYINYPEARLDYLTRFLSVEISSDLVAKISDRLEQQCDNPIEWDSWQMLSQNICTPYFLTSSLPHSQSTQRLLELFFY